MRLETETVSLRMDGASMDDDLTMRESIIIISLANFTAVMQGPLVPPPTCRKLLLEPQYLQSVMGRETPIKKMQDEIYYSGEVVCVLGIQYLYNMQSRYFWLLAAVKWRHLGWMGSTPV